MIPLIRFTAGITILMTIGSAFAEETFGPNDPIAAVDGKPIFLGELNLMLRPMARGKSIDSLPVDVQRAAAIVLVRRHLALRTLRRKGGVAVDDAIGRYVAEKTAAIERTGLDIVKFSTDAKANKESLLQNWAWEAAWNLYVKSRLTDHNLRNYYLQNVQTGDPSFDDLTDQSKLRRDATNALFDALVAAQSDAKVQWFIPALQPPPDVPLVPSSSSKPQSKIGP